MPRIPRKLSWFGPDLNALRGIKSSEVRKIRPVQAKSVGAAWELMNPKVDDSLSGRKFWWLGKDRVVPLPDDFQAKEEARLRRLQRRHEMPGRWRFEFTPNESGGGSREWDLEDGLYSDDSYLYFDAPSRRAGLEAMAVYGSRGGEPDFRNLSRGMKQILADEGIDIRSLTDEELEDFVEELEGPSLIRVQQPDLKYDTRFKMAPARYFGPGVRPRVGFTEERGYFPEPVSRKKLPWKDF